MAEWSGLYTTTTGTLGDAQASYTEANDAVLKRIVAACWGYQGVAPNYLNELKCTVTGANTVQVNTGGGVIDGKVYNNSTAVSVNVPSASGAGNTRIDRIVARYSSAATSVRITRIAGTDAASPSAPAITTTSGTTYDVPLCAVLVDTAGACTVTDERSFASPPELALAVLGNAANTTVATWGAIAATSDHTVLLRHGTSLGWGVVPAGAIGAGAVTAGGYAADSITLADIGALVPGFLGRQGGHATSWASAGTTNYSSGINLRVQAGTHPGAAGVATVTFPVPFSSAPVVFACPISTLGILYQTAAPTATAASVVIVSTAGAALDTEFSWFAVGPE